MRPAFPFAAIAACMLAAAGPVQAGDRLDTAKLYLERNVTDGDIEVVIEAKGDAAGLSELTLVAPDGRRLVDFKVPESKLGIRSVKLESPEPENDGRVQADFPAGNYGFTGTTVDQDQLAGSGVLSHRLPPPASFAAYPGGPNRRAHRRQPADLPAAAPLRRHPGSDLDTGFDVDFLDALNALNNRGVSLFCVARYAHDRYVMMTWNPKNSRPFPSPRSGPSSTAACRTWTVRTWICSPILCSGTDARSPFWATCGDGSETAMSPHGPSTNA